MDFVLLAERDRLIVVAPDAQLALVHSWDDCSSLQECRQLAAVEVAHADRARLAGLQGLLQALPRSSAACHVMALLRGARVRVRAVDEHQVDRWDAELLQVRVDGCHRAGCVACAVDLGRDEDRRPGQPACPNGGTDLVLVVVAVGCVQAAPPLRQPQRRDLLRRRGRGVRVAHRDGGHLPHAETETEHNRVVRRARRSMRCGSCMARFRAHQDAVGDLRDVAGLRQRWHRRKEDGDGRAEHCAGDCRTSRVASHRATRVRDAIDCAPPRARAGVDKFLKKL
eukprot:SAG31_NODE_953_length_10799_cov_4.245657_2_plen_282_part_00